MGTFSSNRIARVLLLNEYLQSVRIIPVLHVVPGYNYYPPEHPDFPIFFGL
jgi:hypothetical protein